MSAEYSVDGILAVAEAAYNGDVRHPGMVADMLREFARIKADASTHPNSPDAADSGRVDVGAIREVAFWLTSNSNWITGAYEQGQKLTRAIGDKS